MNLVSVLLLPVAGLAAGTVNGIAGGGSLITFPALIAVGLPSVAANVTNSIGVFPGNAATVAGSYRDLRDLAASQGRGLLLSLIPTVIVGTVTGCALLLATPSRSFDLIVPFLVLGAGAVLAFRDRIRTLIGHPANLSPGRRAAALHTVVGLGTIYGGYFGAALGVILVSTLAVVIDDVLARVSALKNVVSSFCGFVTVIVFAAFGPVHWVDVAIIVPSNILGGYLGARLARVLPARVLRAVIVTFATTVGLILLVKALR
jgi:uncharacterized protein